MRLPVPQPESLDPAALLLGAAAMIALLRLHLNLILVLAASAALGLAHRLATT